MRSDGSPPPDNDHEQSVFADEGESRMRSSRLQFDQTSVPLVHHNADEQLVQELKAATSAAVAPRVRKRLIAICWTEIERLHNGTLSGD